jgi:hypothetical protein
MLGHVLGLLEQLAALLATVLVGGHDGVSTLLAQY